MRKRLRRTAFMSLFFMCSSGLSAALAAAPNRYEGRFCEGEGDVDFIRLIDDSFAFFHPGPVVPNLSMLYQPDWDTFEEGAGWGAWWIQNSYGFAYAATPFLQEPWFSTLQRSLDLFWARQGDGKRVSHQEPPLVVPDGSLGDCASPGGIVYKQGDGNVSIHDWFYEATAAGVVMQAEILLAGRDRQAMARYLPMMRRACDFIERTRDPTNNLFLVGPACNLLAPSYGGVRQPDGSFGKGYLAGLSITYLAALDRMVEVFKLVDDQAQLAEYERRQLITRGSLPRLLTPGGYFVKSVEPNGVMHGVLGQVPFGYLEGVANADALALRVADDATARSIYKAIREYPAIRPFDFLLNNAPGLDDTYWLWGAAEPLEGFHRFGDWVNGGCWGTVEGRAILGYYRVGAFEDVRRSAARAMKWAKEFRMDAPWSQRGENSANSWSDTGANHVGGVSVMVDNFAIPAATIRGLFDYEYRCDRLILRPRVPRTVTAYKQKEPVRFGGKRLYLSCRNGGTRVESVTVNGQSQEVTSSDAAVLLYEQVPEEAHVEIVTGGGWEAEPALPAALPTPDAVTVAAAPQTELPESLRRPHAMLTAMAELLAGAPDVSEIDRAFVREALGAISAWRDRTAIEPQGFFRPMTVEKRDSIVRFYEKAALAMFKGFNKRMSEYANSPDAAKKRVADLYRQIGVNGTAALLVSVAQYSSEPNASGLNGHFPVSSNDLGQAAGTTLAATGVLTAYDGAMTDKNGNPLNGAAYLFDGGRAYGGKYPTTATSSEFDPDVAVNYWRFDSSWCCATPATGATLTVTFPPRAGGHDISSIVSLSGYAAGRQVQAYAVAVLAHGSAEWTDLGTVSGGTDGFVAGGFHEVRLTVTGGRGGLLASGADAVRFTFLNTTDYGMSQSGGVSVYREIDINGKAAE